MHESVKNSLGESFQKTIKKIEDVLQQENLEWRMKGLIDTNGYVYPLGVDTKLISKIIELMIFPVVQELWF